MKMTKTPPRQSSSAIWHKNSNYKCNLSDDKYVVVIDGNFLEKCIINFVSKQQNATLLLKLLFTIMKEFVEFGVQDVLYWANFSNGILANLPQVIHVAFSKVDRDSFWVEGGVIVTYVPKKFIQETVHVENFTLQPKFATRWFNIMNCYRWGDDSFFELANSYFGGPVRVHKELKRFRLISASTGFLLVLRRTLERSCDSFYHFVLHLAATASVFPNAFWKRCKDHKRLQYV